MKGNRKWVLPVAGAVLVILLGYMYLFQTVRNAKNEWMDDAALVPSMPEPTIAAEQAGTPDLGTVTPGTETYREFTIDNLLHSKADGDIHYVWALQNQGLTDKEIGDFLFAASTLDNRLPVRYNQGR